MKAICLMLTMGVAFGQQVLWEQHMKEAGNLQRAGRYQDAKAVYLLALKDEGPLSNSGFRQATTWNNLALVERYLGSLRDARQGYQRALELFEKARGPDSPEYASVLQNLAVLDYMEGQMDEAARQFRRALKIREDVLGSSHPATAQTLNSLSAVHASQGEYAEAERFCRNALAIQEKELGPEHPQVSATLDNLASIYRARGQVETALEVSLRAEQIARREYGDRHPLTCLRASKVAVLYGDLGRFAEADELLRRILEVQQGLGEDNPDAAATMASLAAVCFHRGRLDESRALYERARAILAAHPNDTRRLTVDLNELLGQRSYGKVTTESWNRLNDEGNRLREQGLCRQAVPVLLRARSAAVEELGPNHASAATPANNLAAAYFCLGEFTRAEQLFKEALALLNGDAWAETRGGVLNNFGLLLMRLNRMKEAEEVFYQALAIRETAHGAHHPATAIALTSLGVLRLHTGAYTEARNLFRRSLDICEASLGDHLHTATALNNLGVVNLYLQEYEEAKDVTTRALDLRRRLLPPRHPDIGQSLYNYAVALDKLGQSKLSRAAFHKAASIQSGFASDNLVGLTVDVRVLDRK